MPKKYELYLKLLKIKIDILLEKSENSKIWYDSAVPMFSEIFEIAKESYETVKNDKNWELADR